LISLSNLFYLGFEKIDNVVNEVTDGNPKLIDFETQLYLRNITYFSKIGDAMHEKKYVKMH